MDLFGYELFFLCAFFYVYDGEPLECNAQLCCDPYRKDVNKESYVLCATSPAHSQSNKKESATRGIPRRSPIQVLAPPAGLNFGANFERNACASNTT